MSLLRFALTLVSLAALCPSLWCARDITGSSIQAPESADFSHVPLSVQMRFKKDRKDVYHILIANETKKSPHHWEIYTAPKSGFLCVYAPKFFKGLLDSKTDVSDNKWHELAFVMDGEKASLYLDGQLKATQPMTQNDHARAMQPLRIGGLVEGGMGYNGSIAEVRIAHDAQVASAPWPTDGSVIAHWKFNNTQEDFTDLSSKKRALRYTKVFREMGTPDPKPYVKEQIASYADPAQWASGVQALSKELKLSALSLENAHAGVWHIWTWDLENYGKADYAKERQIPLSDVADWEDRAREEVFDKNALILPEDKGPAGTVLRRAKALAEHLEKAGADSQKLSVLKADLEKLATAWTKEKSTDEQKAKAYYYTACALRRQLAFLNPLLNFDDVLVAARGTFEGSIRSLPRTNDGVGGHMSNQYFGFNTIPAGGLFVFKNWRGTPQVVDLLKDAVVQNGRWQGKKLENGSVATPDLSFDGKKIAFAWSANQAHNLNRYAQDNTFHIFTINADGTDLRQLTDGTEGDFDPCFLPSGRIAFISERRGGHIRCFASYLRVRNYTLFDMEQDGSDIRPLSYFETSEWNPSVNNDGMIVYSRWDYVDRENCIGGRFWIAGPDGTNPRAPHGNYPRPFSTIDAKQAQQQFEKEFPGIPWQGWGSR